MKPDTSVHSLRSSYREKLLEHLLIGEILRHLWEQRRYAEVLKPEVDDGGYDIVIDCDSVMRHIQLKASYSGARTASVNVNIQLEKKPSGCVIWILFDRDTLGFKSYRWFGAEPGKHLPQITGFKKAKHTKGDSTGRKATRPNIRILPKREFTEIKSIKKLVAQLFG